MKLQPKKILYLFAIIGIISCKKGTELPKGIISLEKMPHILADLQLAEADVSRLNIGSYDSSKVVYQYLQQQILEKHNVDSTKYRVSYEAYGRNPAYMEKIYDEVLKLLEARTDSIRKRPQPSDENPPK